MSSHISVLQNEPDSTRLLAAQSQLYTDVKRESAARLIVVITLSVALSVTSVLNNDKGDTIIGTVGGLVLLVLDSALQYRERRRSALAAAIQETFDCRVFGLPWNDLATPEHPPGQQISAAAVRYKGRRTQDWYPNTGTLRRPLDVAICQQSNVGWGAPIHRAWAWTLAGALVAVIVVLAITGIVLELSGWAIADALVLPFLPLLVEAMQTIKANLDSAREKERTQQAILTDWHETLHGTGMPKITEERCRRYQDSIASIRTRNALVPDRFDSWKRRGSERDMRTTARDMIAEARRFGYA